MCVCVGILHRVWGEVVRVLQDLSLNNSVLVFCVVRLRARD